MAGKKIIKNAPDGFDNSLLTYKPVYPQAPMDMKYHYYDDGVLKIRPEVGKLVTSVEELREYAESCKGCMVAVDTETTGLTYDKDFIVGFSVAKDAYHGIYVPIRHQIKRIDKIEDVKRDEDGNILYTKAGKPRKETRKETTIFENPANLPDKECLDILYEIMLNAKLVLMHNSEFDLTMIRQEGYDVLKCHTFDTTILTYLYDSENKGWNKLKEASKIVLGRHPMKFAEALGDEENFRFVDLTVGAPYGASDSACTYGLFQKLYPEVRKLLSKAPQRIIMSGEKTPYDVMSKDNELIRAFTDYYNRVDLRVDKQAALEYKIAVEKALEETDSKIYAHFNRGIFNLSTSSKEFKTAMYEAKIETGLKTDKGATSYSKKGIDEMSRSLATLKDILENFKTVVYEDGKLQKLKSANTLKLSRLIATYGKEQFQISENSNSMSLRTIEGIKCTHKEFFDELKLMYKTVKRNMEVLQLIQRHSSLMKALNSYIAKLTETDICHMRYRLQGTASGRLSSGNGSKTDKRKNHYFIDLNAQNLTKPSPAFYKAEESNEEGNILGWKFTQVSDEYYHENKDKELIVEGANPKNNIRKCIIAPEGRYIMSLDYSAQEYLVLAILSRDSKMIENFKNGVDPHTATAYGIWGKENYDKAKRKKAKMCIGDDVLLLTNNGYKTVPELDEENDLIYDMDGNAQHWAKFVTQGKLLQITYDNGITESYTPDHEVQVWDGEKIIMKEVQELTEQDDVIQYVGRPNDLSTSPCVIDYSDKVIRKTTGKNFAFDINTKEFAYLAGIYLGDGNLMKYTPAANRSRVGEPRGVTYCVTEEMKEQFESCCGSLKLDYGQYKLIGKNKKISRVDSSNVAWANLIEDLLGSVEHKHLDKRFYTMWNNECWKYFLAGLIDTDGYTCTQRMNFASKNFEIIRAAQMACSIIGAKYYCSLEHTKYKGRDYPYHMLTIVYCPDIPITIEEKRKYTNIVRANRISSWNVKKEFAVQWRNRYKEWGDNYKSHYYATWNNVVAGYSKITEKIIDVTKKYVDDFPLKDYMTPVHVKNIKNISGNVNVLETKNHLYRSLGAGNRNCNFLMNYSGGAYTLSKNLNVPVEEAEHIIDAYKKHFFECIQWKEDSIKKCIQKQDGVCYTLFGRPRQFKSRLMTSADLATIGAQGGTPGCSASVYQKKANATMAAVGRRIVSHLIQSTCGDICRWDLIRLYRKFFKKRNPDIDFYTTVHDEINYTVVKDKLVEYARMVDDIMTIYDFRKDLPIKTSIDVGYTLGTLFPFEWADKERTKLVPKRA